MKTYTIKLDATDLFQAIDGLEVRAESWERTAEYLRTNKFPDGELFLIEDCSKPEEADEIAAHYRAIVQRIRKQVAS